MLRLEIGQSQLVQKPRHRKSGTDLNPVGLLAAPFENQSHNKNLGFAVLHNPVDCGFVSKSMIGL